MGIKNRIKRVLVFGTFDGLHLGHESFLKQARELGNELHVIVARDETVTKVKGKEPELKELDRLHLLQNNISVTEAHLGNLDDKYKLIGKIKPNVIALGYDQFVFTYRLHKVLIDFRLNAEIVRLDPYKPNIYKSSLIDKKKTSPGLNYALNTP